MQPSLHGLAPAPHLLRSQRPARQTCPVGQPPQQDRLGIQRSPQRFWPGQHRCRETHRAPQRRLPVGQSQRPSRQTAPPPHWSSQQRLTSRQRPWQRRLPFGQRQRPLRQVVPVQQSRLRSGKQRRPKGRQVRRDWAAAPAPPRKRSSSPDRPPNAVRRVAEAATKRVRASNRGSSIQAALTRTRRRVDDATHHSAVRQRVRMKN